MGYGVVDVRRSGEEEDFIGNFGRKTKTPVAHGLVVHCQTQLSQIYGLANSIGGHSKGIALGDGFLSGLR